MKKILLRLTAAALFGLAVGGFLAVHKTSSPHFKEKKRLLKEKKEIQNDLRLISPNSVGRLVAAETRLEELRSNEYAVILLEGWPAAPFIIGVFLLRISYSGLKHSGHHH